MSNKLDHTQPALQVRGLSKEFVQGDKTLHILNDVQLSVVAGESVAIVGASGSGKSTLLHLLGGLDTATSGQVLLANNDLLTVNEEQRGLLRNKHLGFIYQFHHLLSEFTAVENVAMPLLIRGTDTATAEELATNLLTQVGLGDRLSHKPGELSGGERQRAAVARAMVTQPSCILADEPTGNLDENTAARVFRMLLNLNRQHKTALILVTHDLSLARRADRCLELTGGQLQPLES